MLSRLTASRAARLGHDFSQVRIHADESGAKAAQAQNAEAYTLGSHIFRGCRLLSRDAPRPAVAHTRIDARRPADRRSKRKRASSRGGGDHKREPRHRHQAAGPPSCTSADHPATAKAPKPIPLDAEAEQIIGVLLANPSDKRDRKTRSVEFVYRILNKYFVGYSSRVAGVGFDNEQARDGLAVSPRQSPTTKEYFGFIWVGDRFIDDIVESKYGFADHLAKIDHELAHIDQWRSGMVGPSSKNEREFLAHARESAFEAPAGAGGMHHSTRARHIDVALGLYCCLDDVLKRKHLTLQQELLKAHPREARYGHAAEYPEPPTRCIQPEDWQFR